MGHLTCSELAQNKIQNNSKFKIQKSRKPLAYFQIPKAHSRDALALNLSRCRSFTCVFSYIAFDLLIFFVVSPVFFLFLQSSLCGLPGRSADTFSCLLLIPTCAIFSNDVHGTRPQ